MGVIDLVAPIKARQIKQNSQKRFHGKVAEKKSVRDKLLKKKKINQNLTMTRKYIK